MFKLTVFPDQSSFIGGAADFIAEHATRSIAERGQFVLALSGGSTPRSIYARLATSDFTDRINWLKVQIFFGDERCVPQEDSLSNYRMAREALLDHVTLPPGNIHRIRGEEDPFLASTSYERELQRFFRSTSAPIFDLILLGLGENGHTASLFPGTAVLRERERWVVPQYVETLEAWRVTFSPVLINAARDIAFLVEGEAKAEILWRVLAGPYNPDELPAQLIQPNNGQLHWLLDAAAASRVQPV
jgi:6-phosphogluconolactonase